MYFERDVKLWERHNQPTISLWALIGSSFPQCLCRTIVVAPEISWIRKSDWSLGFRGWVDPVEIENIVQKVGKRSDVQGAGCSINR